MRPLAFLIDVLAVRRLVRLVTSDEITRPLRERAGQLNPWLGYLASCPACTSVWAAGAVTSVLPRRVVLGLALSEGAILIGNAEGMLEESFR